MIKVESFIGLNSLLKQFHITIVSLELLFSLGCTQYFDADISSNEFPAVEVQ